MSTRRSLRFQFIAGLAVAVFFLWLAIRQIPLEPGQSVGQRLGDAFSSVPLWVTVAYAASFVLVHLLRTARWVYQVRGIGVRDTALVFRVCIIGYAAIVLFPFRIGEIVRPYLLARETQVPFSRAMGTAVVERILDGLLITGLFFVCTALAPNHGSAVVTSAGLMSLAVFLGATVLLALFRWQRAWGVKLLSLTVGVGERVISALSGGRIQLAISGKVEGMISEFFDGITALKSEGVLGGFFVLTALYWSVNALGIWLLAVGFGLAIPWYAGFGLLAVLVVGIMIPGAPGLLGTFQIALNEGLKLYVASADIGAAGLAFAILMNAIQFVIQTGVALPYLLRSNGGLGGLMELQRQATGAHSEVETADERQNNA